MSWDIRLGLGVLAVIASITLLLMAASALWVLVDFTENPQDATPVVLVLIAYWIIKDLGRKVE